MWSNHLSQDVRIQERPIHRRAMVSQYCNPTAQMHCHLRTYGRYVKKGRAMYPPKEFQASVAAQEAGFVSVTA